MIINNISKLRFFRKKLRHNLTPAEAKLWIYLKQSQLEGRKFRRQHSISGYILDFYCPTENLAIELDGEAHNTTQAQENDEMRDLFLLNYGIKILRFENKFIFSELDGLLMIIKNNFGWNNTTPSLRDTPP